MSYVVRDFISTLARCEIIYECKFISYERLTDTTSAITCDDGMNFDPLT